ncbi:MAG: hypothetical protein VB058_05825 [Oscillospiraceae bacterium]|nr:hypothetical protein [Oscillospiraceae bacterium]
MKPLKQWVCDVCGELIEKPEDGYVIWKCDDKDSSISDIKIVHTSIMMDDGKIKGCDFDDYNYPCSMDLSRFLGADGAAYLLSFLDLGPHIPTERCRVKDMPKFVDFFRRVQLPYYEEARIFWQKAYNDGFFNGANEIWPYTQDTLKRIIREYKN